jgi:excinuclease ABC subunit C
MRGRRRRGTQYFGPYAHAYAIRDTLDLLFRTFPVRTCTDTKFKHHAALCRPCLLFHIERCSGPCVGEVTPEQYTEYVDGLADFLDGETDEVAARLEITMKERAEAQQYEAAARVRDQLFSVQRATARQELVTQRRETFDLIAFAEDELEAVLVVLNVRRAG